MCHSGGQLPEDPRMGLGGNLVESLDEEAPIVEHEQNFLDTWALRRNVEGWELTSWVKHADPDTVKSQLLILIK